MAGISGVKFTSDTILEYSVLPPTKDYLSKRVVLDEESFFSPAFCSKEIDIPPRPVEVGGNQLKIKSNTISELKDFSGNFQHEGIDHWKLLLETCQLDASKNIKTRVDLKNNKLLTPNLDPPNLTQMKAWFVANNISTKANSDRLKLNNCHEPPCLVINKSFESPKSVSNSDFDNSNQCQAELTRAISFKNIGSLSQTSTPSLIKNKGKIIPSLKRLSKKKKLRLSESFCLTSLSPIREPKSTETDLLDSSIIPATPGNNTNQEVGEEIYVSDSMNITLKQEFANSQFKKHFILESPLNTSSSQLITGPSFDASYDFKLKKQDLKKAKALHEHDYLTLLCLECHIQTRPNLVPDPLVDQIAAIFFSIVQDVPDEYSTEKELRGVILVVDDNKESFISNLGDKYKTCYVNSEEKLIEELLALVLHWDPDILVGYEVQRSSWGFLLERCAAINIDLITSLSRVPEGQNSYFDVTKDEYGADHTHEIHVRGRIILNVWRLMRSEVPLQSYTLENVSFHVLHIRVPNFSFNTLTNWWKNSLERWRTVEHYVLRCDLTIKLLNKLDLISRTSELARLFGIPFYDVLARGTQFRVESMMLRLSRAENLIAISPSIDQRARMKSPEWLALNMEPESKFYTDPVLVLDFQSLYPSMMIAYNYCYSTCLGRVSSLGESNEPFVLGTSHLQVDPSYLEAIIDQINFSPCGVAFVQSSIKKGILPKMLEEILQTRLMVKSSMKHNKDDPSLTKILHSRQLGLKLIANVTYGYTSANFSGRMPCSEVGDSVVSKGRETLERAISLVNSSSEWNAKVVYGDTDSLFVHLPGRTKEQAFRIGNEIAEQVTSMNPKPVKLKFEKVYLPCILQTKKRYVGYMYETLDQENPVFDAKGIETVRRDSCPAVAKILEKSLTSLFNFSDISLVKDFVQRQFKKILQGSAAMQDLIFAKEYRGFGGYRPSARVPALELARQWAKVDKRREPRTGERVPYVIVYGAPGLPLIKLVRSPENLFSDSSLRINAVYYITRAIIPPLQRCFSLLGIDVNKWFSELPRTTNFDTPNEYAQSSSIVQYFVSTLCPACNGTKSPGGPPLCQKCLFNPQQTVISLSSKVKNYQRTLDQIRKICRACIGYPLNSVECISLDCPIVYRHNMEVRRSEDILRLQKILEEL